MPSERFFPQSRNRSNFIETMEMIKTYLILCSTLLTVSVSNAFSQLATQKADSDNCELQHAKLDAVGDKFKKLAKDDSSLIILAGSSLKLGNRFDRRRLTEAKKISC